MKEYEVVLEIVGYAYVTVEADSPAAAMALAHDSWQIYAPDAQNHELKGIGWLSGDTVEIEPV